MFVENQHKREACKAAAAAAAKGRRTRGDVQRARKHGKRRENAIERKPSEQGTNLWLPIKQNCKSLEF